MAARLGTYEGVATAHGGAVRISCDVAETENIRILLSLIEHVELAASVHLAGYVSSKLSPHRVTHTDFIRTASSLKISCHSS